MPLQAAKGKARFLAALGMCISPLNDWTKNCNQFKSVNLGTMSKNRRTFTAAEKLAIINEAEQFGITQTLRKHNLSNSVYRRWRDQFNEGGVSRLKSYTRERNPELDEAKEQLRLLKNVVARLQMELEFKDELLKKTQSLSGLRPR